MKKKYERVPLRPFGEGTSYHRRVCHIKWCDICNMEIGGNGSIINPYYCDCSTYDVLEGRRVVKNKDKEHGENSIS